MREGPGRGASGAIRFALAASLAVAAFAGGCGYRLTGQGSVIPEHIKALVVQPFENRTSRPEIEQRVTEEVALELSKRGGYKVLTDSASADGLIEGAVTGYRTVPVQFGSRGLATRVEAIVTLQATLRDLSTDQVLWSQDGLTFREQFDVPEGQDFFEQESSALDAIASGAAGALVTSLVEGF
jgi:TolB-like protein